MYIRQESFFSFEEIIKFQPETKLEMILTELNFDNIVHMLSEKSAVRGPKGYSFKQLLYSLVAMQVEQMPYIISLVERLKNDPVFRYNCGFNVLEKTPSLATFSRFLNKLCEVDSLKDELTTLVIEAKKLNIIDGEYLSIDATDFEAYEKPISKNKITPSPTTPDWGSKKGTDGKTKKWFGYKGHLIVDCKSDLPIAASVTPASWNDGIKEVVHPLIDSCIENYKNVLTPKFWIMDKGYDNVHVYEHVVNVANGFPIIPYNPRSETAPPIGFNYEYQPSCSMGYALAFWGIDGDYLKYRCPHVVNKVDCPYGSNWCSNSDYGFCKKFNYKKQPRLYCYPPRATDKWYSIYNLRNSVERCNHRLKNHLNLDNIRSKGAKKALIFVLLSCISLVAGTISVNKLNLSNNIA